MPSYNQRTSRLRAYQARGQRKRTSALISRRTPVPRSIRFRGTPDGYYEIPVTSLFKVYVNTSTGLWQTNQTTGAQIGVTGYRGFVLSTSLSDVNLALGEGSVSTNITQTIPGFSQLQAVFDMVKIARMEVSFHFMANSQDMTTSTDSGAMCMFMAEDKNSINPVSSQSAMLQYSTLKSIYSNNMRQDAKFNIIPYISTDAQTIDGVSSTNGVNEPPTYINTDSPGVAHRGILGWLDASSAGGSARNMYLYITVKQIRRYKISR